MTQPTGSGDGGTGAQAATKRLEFFRTLTEARLAQADDDYPLAYAKFKALLEMDPESHDAKEFIRRYEAGELKVPTAAPQASTSITMRRAKEAEPAPRPKPKAPVGDYNLQELYIVNRGGMLIGHYTSENASIIDKDIMMGMMSAMQMFIKDTFGKKEINLRHMDLAQFDIIICEGDSVGIYAVASGRKTAELRPQLERMARDIDDNYGEKINSWKGKVSDLRWLQALILKLVTGGYIYQL